MSKLRLAVVVSHPIQYFTPVYQMLAKFEGLCLKVIYYSDAGYRPTLDRDFGRQIAWDMDLMSGYEYTILRPGAAPNIVGSWTLRGRHICRALDCFDPDVVLFYGYTYGFCWAAWRWASRHQRGLLYFSDSCASALKVSWPKRLAKRVLLPSFFSCIHLFLTPSDQNQTYLAHYGVPRARMRRCPYAIDTRRFRAALSMNQQVRDAWRDHHGIPRDAFAVLFSGKLIPRKRPQDLLDAVIRLRVQGLNAMAIYVGTGECEQELRQATCGDAATFLGFVNQADIPAVYAAADALAMPSSREAYGLVVTEGAACGLPILISDAVGCVGPNDSAQDGRNAIVYPCGDINALAKSIRLLMCSPQVRQQMGEESLRVAETQDITVAARAILEATREAAQAAGRSGLIAKA